MKEKIKTFLEWIWFVFLGILSLIVGIPLIIIILGICVVYYAAVAIISVIIILANGIADAMRK